MLSQFDHSQKWRHILKARCEDSDGADALNPEEELDALLDDVELEEVVEEEECSSDPDREASDGVEIEELARQIAKTHKLSSTDISLGKFAVTKVRVDHLCMAG
jgi:hypothetical protein